MNSLQINIPGYIKYSILIIGVCAFGFIIYIGQGIIIPLCYALLISILLDPLVNLFQKLKIHRVFAISLALITGVILVLVIIYFISDQLSSFNESLPKFRDKLNSILIQSKSWIADEFHISKDKINLQFDNWGKSLFSESGLFIGHTLTTLTEIIIVWFLIPVYSFLILLYQPLLLVFVEKTFDKSKHKAIGEVMMQGKKIIQSYLVGLFFEAIIMATLNSVALLIIGVDYAILLGIAGAIFNIIPFIGGILSISLPLIIIVVTTGSVSSMLLVTVVYMVIQFTDNHFIIPKIVASRVKINALVSIIVVLIFGSLFGVAGMFLAIPMTAIIKIIFDRIESLKPVGFLLGDDMPVNSAFLNIFKKLRNAKVIEIKENGKIN